MERILVSTARERVRNIKTCVCVSMLARLVPIDAKFFSSLSIARKEKRKVHFITVVTIRRGDTNEKFEAFGKNIRGEEEIKHFENSLVEETAENAFFLPPLPSPVHLVLGWKNMGTQSLHSAQDGAFFPPFEMRATFF